MIPKGTRLYPQEISSDFMYYDGEPYAYWVSCPEYNFYEWILFKEYDDYISVCSPNDCLSALSYDDVMNGFREYSFYEGMDRENLCRTFRQRSIDYPYDFDDFADDCEEISSINFNSSENGIEIPMKDYMCSPRPSLPNGIGYDTWFHQLKVGDKVDTGGRIEIIRKKYYPSYMLGFDADGRTNCAPDGYFPIAIAGCYPVE